MRYYSPSQFSGPIRLSRMIQINGGFAKWRANNVPNWWTTYVQTSHTQGNNATLGHSGAYYCITDCHSQGLSTYAIKQFVDGVDMGGAETQLLDFFEDGRAHSLRFEAWIKNINMSSGDLQLAIGMGGDDPSEATPWLTDSRSWVYASTSAHTFTGSSVTWVGVNRVADTTSGQYYLSEAAILLDEMTLHVDYGKVVDHESVRDKHETPLGMQDYNLYGLHRFVLPLENVTSAQAWQLERWQTLGCPLQLKLCANSASAPPFSMSLAAKSFGLAAFELDGVSRSGEIVLEDYKAEMSREQS